MKYAVCAPFYSGVALCNQNKYEINYNTVDHYSQYQQEYVFFFVQSVQKQPVINIFFSETNRSK